MVSVRMLKLTKLMLRKSNISPMFYFIEPNISINYNNSEILNFGDDNFSLCSKHRRLAVLCNDKK